MKKITVGITILVDKDTNVFSNGIVQNALLMQELLSQCENVERAVLVSTKNVPMEHFVGSYWEAHLPVMIPLSDIDVCDVVILCQGYLNRDRVDALRQKGKKVVKHIMGSSQALFIERILFNQPKSGVHERIHTDAVWMSPHLYERDRFFHEVHNDCTPQSVPYIWEPRFIEEIARAAGLEGYKPSGSPSKVVITAEPNINTVKTAVVPMTIAELGQRRFPDLIKLFVIYCGYKIKDNPDLVTLVLSLNIHKAKKMVFQPRYALPRILKNHTDIVLCHQNQCELNYLYLDAAWFGFPVIHNSPMMKELGFYYPGNDVNAALDKLNYVSQSFDTRDYPDQKYLNKSREYASRYRIANNIKPFEDLLENLFL